MKKKVGTSIGIFSGKGGVGKTSMTLSLAGVYEIMTKRVLIIDLDLTGGQIAFCLQRDFTKTVYNFCDDVKMHRFSDFQDYVTAYDDYIDFIACPKDPRDAAKIDAFYLKTLLDKAVYFYDVVLIDMSHVLNEANLLMLDEVSKILFVLNNDPMDVKNLKNLVTIFKDLDKKNYDILLYEAKDPLKKYFLPSDIEDILNENIKYYISDEFYVKNLDEYIMNGQLVSLHPKAASVFNKDFSVLTRIASDMIKDGD